MYKRGVTRHMSSLYDKEHICPVCLLNFYSKRVLVSKIRTKKIESDFCTQYHGENPQHYSILVCPTCGFTYSENTSKIKAQEVEKLSKFLLENPAEEDFSQPRDHYLALKSFERALIIGEFRKEKILVLANYCLQIAWIYRFLGDQKKENEYLKKALKYFIEGYEKEADASNVARVMYIIAEINKRLENEKEAVRWFTRIVNDQKIKDQAIIRMAREQWQQMKK